MSCIFCEIVKGNIPAEVIYDKGGILAIKDISPKAKVHLVIFPREHVADTVHDKSADKVILKIFKTIRETAKIQEIDNTGYRVITNHGRDAHQTVAHVHFHLIGGEPLSSF